MKISDLTRIMKETGSSKKLADMYINQQDAQNSCY